jgi:UDPglucose 6-dehydrogenase
MIVTGLETAELIKYAANCFLATKISFINEISSVCEALGADVQMVAKGMGMDRRIGSKFLHAGPGYGGSCFPKDTQALAAFAREAGTKAGIVEATIEANERQMSNMVDKVFRAAGGRKGARIAVLGVTFKPNTDDMREAPSIRIVAGLKKRGCSIAAFDPVGMPHAATMPEFRGVEWAKDAYGAARGADAVAIITEWNEFRGMNLSRLKRAMRQPVFCDLRNLYDPAEVEKAGLVHVGVGRGRPAAEKSAREARTGERRRRETQGGLARMKPTARVAAPGSGTASRAARRGNSNQ